MNKPIELITISFNEFTSYEWDGSPLYVQCQRIVGYINANTSYPNLSAIFSTPKASRPSGNINIAWLSDQVGPNPKPLSVLRGAEHQAYKRKLAIQLNEMDELIQKIEESGKDKEWASLLKMAIHFGGEQFIFTGNDQVVIAGWSMFPRNLPGPYFMERQKASAPPTVPEPDPASSLVRKEPPLPEPETNTQRFENETHSEPSEPENYGIEPPEEGHQFTETQGEEPKKKSWKWLWWLLLIPLSLLLLWWWLNRESDGSEHLPDEPGVIVPVPPEKIGIGGDSTQTIVLDRLNIALQGQNKSPKAFAKAFKKLYPGNDYAIIYYDTLTNRVQIKVPQKERDALKKELPRQMPDFRMIIWYEGMFNNESIPSDPDYSSARNRWYFEAIGAPGAWDVTYGKEEVVIAIIDNGFDLNHPELKDRAINPYNVVERNSDVFNPASVHGTHVAGLAVGEKDNGNGILGVAPNCKFIPIHVADRNNNISMTAVIDGILYAINQGADVINLSLGKSISPYYHLLPVGMQRDAIENTSLEEEEFWEQIWALAEENGVTVVMAAGNDNVLVGLDPMQRSDYTIKVNAIGPSDEKTVFSNYGPLSTLSAPGLQIYNSLPENNYGFLDGTSMASPIVAGSVGLLKSVNENITPDEVKNHLINTGKRLFSSSAEIGNLIQLDVALANMNAPISPAPGPIPARPTEEADEVCSDLQDRINQLYEEIARLEGQCPNLMTAPDTLRIPDHIDNLGFLEGRWKSTTYLHNNDGEAITIYFNFKANGTGEISFEEPGNSCGSSISFSVNNRALAIDQSVRAACSESSNKYYPYSFRCEPDGTGVADCSAKNKEISLNTFNFNLVKIN